MPILLFDSPHKTGYICAIISAIMFGSVSTIAKPLTASVNPLLLSARIYLISALVLTPLTVRSSVKHSTKKDYMLIFLFHYVVQ